MHIVAYNMVVARMLIMAKQIQKKKALQQVSLTLYATGQYCKKIKGTLHYFGIDNQGLGGVRNRLIGLFIGSHHVRYTDMKLNVVNKDFAR